MEIAHGICYPQAGSVLVYKVYFLNWLHGRDLYTEVRVRMVTLGAKVSFQPRLGQETVNSALAEHVGVDITLTHLQLSRGNGSMARFMLFFLQLGYPPSD